MTKPLTTPKILQDKLDWIMSHNRSFYMGAEKNASALALAVTRYRRLMDEEMPSDYDSFMKEKEEIDAQLAKALGVEK